MKLSELKVGEKGTVVAVNGEGAVRHIREEVAMAVGQSVQQPAFRQVFGGVEEPHG